MPDQPSPPPADAYGTRHELVSWAVSPAGRQYPEPERPSHETLVAAISTTVVTRDGSFQVPLTEIVFPEEMFDRRIGAARIDAWTALVVADRLRAAAEHAISEVTGGQAGAQA